MKSIRLFGGHRNQVFRIDGKVKIVWRDGLVRRAQIREGVLLENFVAVHTDIKARMLVDKSKPVQEEDWKLVTYFHYVDGEIRYPWNLDEIASAAKLLTRLHQKVGPWNSSRSDLSKRLHLDFARGNVLFEPETSTAIGVIDFETTAMGPIGRELGRTLSLLLVDTPLEVPGTSWKFPELLRERSEALLTNYGSPYRTDEVFRWATRYLKGEDYGNLNAVRDKAIEFLLHSSPTSYPAS